MKEKICFPDVIRDVSGLPFTECNLKVRTQSTYLLFPPVAANSPSFLSINTCFSKILFQEHHLFYGEHEYNAVMSIFIPPNLQARQ